MPSPLVSICVPTYNGSKYLRQCISSCIDQTYTNIEIIICDDISSDDTIAIAEEFKIKDERIKLFINEKNLGLVDNWNKCISLATGEWIKFVFQDDYIQKECVEKMITASNNTNALVVCKREFILDDSQEKETANYYKNVVLSIEKLKLNKNLNCISPSDISNAAAENICLNFIGEPPTVMFKKEVISKIGLFNNLLSQICDLEYNLRIATNYGIVYVPEVLVFVRIHKNSATSYNLSEKHFLMRHIDPVLLTRELLFNKYFENFRNYLNSKNKFKLIKYFEVRSYEAYLALRGSENAQYFNELTSRFTEIKKQFHPSLLNRLIYLLVLIKRKIQNQ